MQIAVDCRLFGQSGIGTFIQSIVDYFIVDSSIFFLLIGKKEKLMQYTQYENVRIQESDIAPFSLKEIFAFPVKDINKCDAFFTPYINIPFGIRVPIFSTIHDVIFFDLKHLTSCAGRNLRWLFYKNTCKKSKLIFTVSEFSKKRIEHHFHPSCPIEVVYNGIAKFIKESFTSETQKKKYIIYVGNIKPHKGLKTLIEAYEMARKKGLKQKLMIVGEYRNFKTQDNGFLQQLEKNQENIIFTGRLSDELLIQRIAEADVLVLPSFYEGFGIPPLEALFLGTDAIVSDIPALCEIYQNLPVTFFQSGNAGDLSQKLLNHQKNSNDDFHKAKCQIDNTFNFNLTANKIIETIKANI